MKLKIVASRRTSLLRLAQSEDHPSFVERRGSYYQTTRDCFQLSLSQIMRHGTLGGVNSGC